MITHHLNGGSIVTEQRTNAAGETRMIVDMRASVDDDSTLRICLQLDDLMNRHLITRVLPEDTADQLVTDLVLNGFISEVFILLIH